MAEADVPEVPEVPSPELWTTPISWAGSPLQPVEDYSREFSTTTVFTRAELIYSLSESIGPGMTRNTEKCLPGLIRLDKGKPVEVHVVGLDGQCWTYRATKRGRKTRWVWYVGSKFPAGDAVPDSVASRFTFEYIIVQSVLMAAGTGKVINFMIRDDFRAENLANVEDPDPND